VSHFRDHITNAKALDIKVLVCFFLFLGHIAQTECKGVASCYSCSMGQSVCVCLSVYWTQHPCGRKEPCVIWCWPRSLQRKL